MGPVTGKRKRDANQKNASVSKKTAVNGKKQKAPVSPEPELQSDPASNGATSKGDVTADTSAPLNVEGSVTIQIITGSYERVLHGFSARIPCKLLHPDSPSQTSTEDPVSDAVAFADTFLFTPHTTSIRCLAVSPPAETGKRLLATGSTDERINLFQLSTVAPRPSPSSKPRSTLPTTANPTNRPLGSLTPHSRPLTSLLFPTKTKLLSAAEDNTISIHRTRDWTTLSAIRAPIPTATHRPSGDTATAADLPAGVNDFAVHPSQKLMLSVGRGERCVRLWNLMTGKRAGVLGFERHLLAQVEEGRYGSGEGRGVLWDLGGECYVVAFERGCVVFGLDSRAKAVVKLVPGSKVTRVRFLPVAAGGEGPRVLAVGTEDGRVVFFDLRGLDLEGDGVDERNLPRCLCVGQMGGRAAGVVGRVKDFELFALPGFVGGGEAPVVVVAGGSDGAVRVWAVWGSELSSSPAAAKEEVVASTSSVPGKSSKSVGTLLGLLETSNRITCLSGFVMDEPVAGEEPVADAAEEESASLDEEDASESDSSDG